MRKLLIILFFIYSWSFLQGQSWYWGEEGNTTAYISSGGFISSDAAGNAYQSGEFWDTLHFGATRLIGDTNGNRSIFLVKYDSSGTLKWATQSSLSRHHGSFDLGSIAIDGAQNVYMTGSFIDTVQFGSYTFTSANWWDMYFIKYNANGNVSWAKQAITNAEIDAYSVATDNKYNVYFTGSFYDSIQIGNNKLFADEWSTFVAKFDSAGNILWIKTSLNGGVYGFAWGYSVSTDKNDNSYLSGYFWDTVRFDNYTLRGQFASPSVFVVKYDSAGNIIWAKQSTVNRLLTNSTSSTTDSTGNTYVLGTFSDTISFDAFHLISDSSINIFIAKFNTNGKVVWCEDGYIPIPTAWDGGSIVCDNSGHLYMVALNSNVGMKKIAFGKDTLRSSDTLATFLLVQLDTNGNGQCGLILPSSIDGSYVAVNPSGKDIYLSGIGGYRTVFGPDSLSSHGVFTARWNPDCLPTGIDEITNNNNILSVYPNPSQGLFTFRISSDNYQSIKAIEIYNVLGECVMLKQVQYDYEVNLSAQPNGVYFYRITSDNDNLIGEGKLVIQK